MRIESLLTEDAYAHPVEDLRLLDTHISWVILTGPFAYKIKKPVKLEFLDYSTLERRKHFCEEELRLNRFWAPDLYVDVVPITGSQQGPRIDGTGEPIDYAVKMVEFPSSEQLDVQLDQGLVTTADVVSIAEMIAGKHASAAVCGRLSEDDALRMIRQPMLENIEHLKSFLPAKELQPLAHWTLENLEALWPVVLERQQEGFVRECHGDLKLSNLVRLRSGIVAYDCVEFSSDLRNVDVISDVSFLMMDIAARGRDDLAYLLLNRYLERTGDYAGIRLLRLYFVYHALIRAKIAAIHSVEREIPIDRDSDLAEVSSYTAVARQCVDAPRPCLIAMHGFSGSGKTWLSGRLLARLPAIRLRSDIERRRRHGLDETGESGAGVATGIYEPQARADIYRELAGISEMLLGTGQNVIADASFLRYEDRQLFRDLAQRCDVDFIIVDVTAEPGELRRRLQHRAEEAGDASEADERVLAHQYEHDEALDAEELGGAVAVNCDADVDIDAVIDAIKARRAY